MPRLERDPLSKALDGGARRFLARVYEARGEWVQTRLADPDITVRAWAMSLGIDPGGRDNASTLSGRHVNYRSRWGRAFARAVYYQHKWYGGPTRMRAGRRTVPYDRPLELEIGRHVPARGIIPPGRLVRARLRPGGQAARRAVARLPVSARIYNDRGEPEGGRWSDMTGRDWLGDQRRTVRGAAGRDPDSHGTHRGVPADPAHDLMEHGQAGRTVQ